MEPPKPPHTPVARRPSHEFREHGSHVEPLGHDVPVSAVRGRDDVVGAQLRAHADRHRLLAN
jgi:hypothetical protein